MTGNDDWADTEILGPPAQYPLSRPQLRDSPFYLPNIVAAIVASVGTVVGSIGPWASVGALSLGGLSVKPWGLVILVLGVVIAVALFVQLNLGRTIANLRWAVPVCWLVLVAAVAALAIALVEIVRIRSIGAEYEDEIWSEVGWGLWLAVICAGVLCITTPIVATQVAKAADSQAGTGSSTWTSSWRWGAVAASAATLIIAVFNGYQPRNVEITAGDTTTKTVVISPPVSAGHDPERHGILAEALPADATPCPASFANDEFRLSAVGTSMTSCPFAEAVRRTYINYGVRNRAVVVNVFSPVTEQNYSMTCLGGNVIRCTGGNNAVVYLY